MPEAINGHTVRYSRIAAGTLPVVALLAGGLAGPTGPNSTFQQMLVHGVALALVAALASAWFWFDAREKKFEIHLVHLLGLWLLPVAFVPYYFNQTRDRAERLEANIWFVSLSVTVFIAFWIGCAMYVGGQ